MGNNEHVAPESHVSSMSLDASHVVAIDKLLQWPIFGTLLSDLPRFQFKNFYGEDTYTFFDDLHTQSQQKLGLHLQQDQQTGLAASVHISTDRADVECLVDKFFRRVNNKNPILNRRQTSALCERLYENGSQFDLETCIVLLTCALGAISEGFTPSDRVTETRSPILSSTRFEKLRLGHCYFVAAEKRLGAALSQVSTLAIQCLCLAGIYHMCTISPMRALRMFQSAGSSLQMLASTGSVSPQSASLHNPEGEAELYSSLFWVCYKSEREILAEIPISQPALRVPGFPESYPRPPSAAGGHSDPWASHEQDSWYFFLSEIALRRITNQVAEMVMRHIGPSNDGKHPAPDTSELMAIVGEFERQTEAFRAQLPPSMQFEDVPHAATTEWQQFTRGRYYRALELMHRPFLFTVLHQESPVDPSIRVLAEKSLLNALRYIQHSKTTHRHHGTWLQLRNELREACLLLAGAARGDDIMSMPEGWQDGIAKTLATFEYWDCEFPSCKTYARVIETLANATAIGAESRAGASSIGLDN